MTKLNHEGFEMCDYSPLQKTEKNDTRHGEAGWWKQQFVNADVDRNGVLSFDELRE